jgi:hypothetical protein
MRFIVWNMLFLLYFGINCHWLAVVDLSHRPPTRKPNAMEKRRARVAGVAALGSFWL